MAVQQYTDDEILEAMLVRTRLEDQAEYLGCNRSTIQRRKEDPAFKEKLAKLKQERFTHIVDTIENAAQFAILELQDVCTDPTAPPQARVSAANAILTHLGKFTELAKGKE